MSGATSYEVLEVRDFESLKRAVEASGLRPVYVRAPSVIKEAVWSELSKGPVYCEVVREDSNDVLFFVSPISRLFLFDDMFEPHSFTLADAMAIVEVLRASEYAEVREVSTGRELREFIAEACSGHNNLLVLRPREAVARGYIACASGVVRAALYHDYHTYLAYDGVQMALLTAPHTVVHYRVEPSQLPKPLRDIFISEPEWRD